MNKTNLSKHEIILEKYKNMLNSKPDMKSKSNTKVK